MRPKTTALAMALAASLSILPACRPAPQAAAGANSSTVVAESKTYQGKGVVKGYQSDNKVIILQHEAIPGLMEGMTMGFELKDPAMAQSFKTGDKVAFDLTVMGDSWKITALKRL